MAGRLGIARASRIHLPGQNWVQELADQLTKCEVVVLLYSSSANQSQYVLKEIELAISLDKHILVVRLDDSHMNSAMKYLLRTIQFLNAVQLPDDVWKTRVIQSLRPHLISNISFPIDSTGNRNLKVLVCAAIFKKCYHHLSRVYVSGMGIRINNLESSYVEKPFLVMRQYQQLTSLLGQITDLTSDPKAANILSFVARENVFLAVAISPDRRPHDDLMNRFNWLINEIDILKNQDLSFDVEIRFNNSFSWESPDDLSSIADYLTRLGSKSKAVVSNALDRRTTG